MLLSMNFRSDYQHEIESSSSYHIILVHIYNSVTQFYCLVVEAAGFYRTWLSEYLRSTTMAPTVHHQPYTIAVIPRISLEFSMAWNFEDEIDFVKGDCHWTLLLPCFYNDVVDCLPVDQAT